MENLNETSVTNYKLRVFANSRDPDFIKALKIYTTYIDTTSLTDTNQITFCLDNYYLHYEKSDFIVSGFYQNKQLIGYCQFIYISEEKLIIIDYIAIDEPYRGISVFYVFVEKIRELIIGRGFEVKYLVGEINIHHSLNDEIPIKAQMLIKLLKSNNFGEVKATYIQPMLGADNYESEQKSILMLYPSNQYEAIKRETFLKIVETIYFKHYERWYKLFLNDSELIQYQMHLHNLFSKITEKSSSAKLIQIAGEHFLFGERDFKYQIKEPNIKKGALLIFGFIGLLIILLAFSILLKRILKVDFKDQFYLLLITAVGYLLILSLFSEKAAKVLNRLLEKAIDKLT